MAADRSVPTGTRYDALRILGADSWELRGAQIVRYLEKNANPELQQGAVSALGDMSSPHATAALVAGLRSVTPSNRQLVIEALTRDEPRKDALLDLLDSGQVASGELSAENRKKLTDPSYRFHQRASKLLSK